MNVSRTKLVAKRQILAQQYGDRNLVRQRDTRVAMVVPQYDFDGTHRFAGRILVENGVEGAFYQKSPRTLAEFMADENG